MYNFNEINGTQSRVLESRMPFDTYLENNDKILFLKRGIWIYFLLIIFEGALRKWVLPGWANPLLVIRDPLAIWLIFLCWKQGLLPKNFYMAGMVIIGIIGICTALLFGHGNIPVSIFGARILLIHFPLVFVIGSILNQDDVIRIGRATLLLSIPMVVLIGLQFYSPQSAWVNLGVGGDEEGSGFSGALGYLRPSGTFSFTNGNTLFFGFLASYIFYFWLNPSRINKLVLITATASLFAAISFSISRGLLFTVIIALIFATIASLRKPKFMGRFALAAMGGLLALLLLQQTVFFQIATEAFTTRYEIANKTEGGLGGVFLDRYLGGFIRVFSGPEIPFFGYGIGMGTNVGSQLLTGERQFLVSEGEWGRVIGELGFLMGTALILIRLGFCARIALASYSSLAKGNLLPWMLLSFGLLIIPQGQWAQPTSLGFSTLIAGLVIASLKVEGNHHKGS